MKAVVGGLSQLYEVQVIEQSGAIQGTAVTITEHVTTIHKHISQSVQGVGHKEGKSGTFPKSFPGKPFHRSLTDGCQPGLWAGRNR